MQYNPSENILIVRELDNPNDSGTNYVQAVVRDSKSGTTLSTIKLTDKGNQRFVGSFQAPSDNNGQGRQIDITSYVYSDSGYTTYSQTYGKENVQHLIQQRSVWQGGGGGDMVVDYGKIEKIMGGLKFPDIPKFVDYAGTIEGVNKESKKQYKELTGVVSAHSEAIKTVLQAIFEHGESLKEARRHAEEENNRHAQLITAMHETVSKSLSTMREELNALREDYKSMYSRLSETLSRVTDRPFAVEKELDELKKEHEGYVKRYTDFHSRIKKINEQFPEESYQPENQFELSAKKLLGI